MALILFCAAGFALGLFSDVFALICAMTLTAPSALLICAGAGVVSALFTTGGLTIALQFGFAAGLTSLALGPTVRVAGTNQLTRRPKS